MQHWPIVAIGAGAAGMLAGIFAAEAGVPTLVVDGRRQPGAKIRVSGGGRCNVLPSLASPSDFETRGSSHAMRNILGSWPRDEVEHYFAHTLGVPLAREASGKVFPASNDSRDIVSALARALARAGGHTRFGCRVVAIERSMGGFILRLSDGEAVACTRLIVATGGLSMPKTGSDGGGWRMLRALGHTIVEPVPALVPLCGSPFAGGELAGISLPVRLSAESNGRCEAVAVGDFLFTHRGYSGPVVLDISRQYTLAAVRRLAAGGALPLTIRAAWGRLGAAEDGEARWRAALDSANEALALQVVQRELPRRLAQALVQCAAQSLTDRGEPTAAAALLGRPACELSRPARQALLQHLVAMPLPIDGSEGYRTAEVTSGGVALAEVVTKTLESRVAPGLHICGESLDASGRLGGFNFLWAWVTGRRAGLAAASALTPALV